MKIGLSRFNKSDYDTEEKEFICDYIDELSNVVGVKIKNHLNAFLYGWVLTILLNLTWIFKKESKAIETLSQNCTDCGIKLETFVMTKQQNSSPSCWFIAQCNACTEYNLIYIPNRYLALFVLNNPGYKWYLEDNFNDILKRRELRTDVSEYNFVKAKLDSAISLITELLSDAEKSL